MTSLCPRLRPHQGEPRARCADHPRICFIMAHFPNQRLSSSSAAASSGRRQHQAGTIQAGFGDRGRTFAEGVASIMPEPRPCDHRRRVVTRPLFCEMAQSASCPEIRCIRRGGLPQTTLASCLFGIMSLAPGLLRQCTARAGPAKVAAGNALGHDGKSSGAPPAIRSRPSQCARQSLE
jgi:hypothetical protein